MLPSVSSAYYIYADYLSLSANSGFDFLDDGRDRKTAATVDVSDYIIDIREYDVPYHVRVAIDLSKILDPHIEKNPNTDYRYPSRSLVQC